MSLEKQLGGGIPLGSLTLVEGSSSSGKSVLCQHLAYGALLDGHAVAYFTSEKSPKALTGQMGSIGLGVSSYVRGDKLRMYPIKEPNEAGTTNDGEDPGSLMASLSADVENLTDKHRVIIIDSISNLATFTPDLAVLSFLLLLQASLQRGSNDHSRGPLGRFRGNSPSPHSFPLRRKHHPAPFEPRTDPGKDIGCKQNPGSGARHG